MSYQNDREQTIARLTREGLDLGLILTLLRAATTINRNAELACSSEAADRDRVPCPAMPRINNKGEIRETGDACLCDMYEGKHERIPRIRLQDARIEARLRKALPAGWGLLTEGDPCGYTLKVIPPSYAERNKGRDRANLEAIGIPPGPSRIRW